MENEEGTLNYENMPVGAEQGPESHPIPEDEILGLFQELRQAAAADDPIRDLARTVENLCVNKPVQDLISFSNYARQLTNPSVTVQLLNNLTLTWASLITKNRPSVYAVAQTKDLQAVMAAQIATKYIEYFETEEGTADHWHQTALWAAQHGTGAMQIVYDPKTERVIWTPLSIFDLWLENRADPADVDWCVVRSYITQYEARDLLRTVNPDAGLPAETDYRDAFDISRKGVEKYSIWYRPSARYPRGLYACVINDTVVESMDYPYIFAEPDGAGTKALLPVVWWQCRRNRGATLGLSWTNDCAPIQATINTLFSKINDDALNARQVMLLPSSLRNSDLIDEENARIFIDPASADQASLIRWVSPAPVDPNVQTTLQKNIESMYVTSGISQSTSGDAAASQSGKALAYQAALDADKHADAFKNFERAQRAAWELTIRLVQLYYSTQRQHAIAGQDPFAISGADIAGVTVKLEPRSESESAASNKTEKAKADIAAGFAGREALLDSSPTPMTAGIGLMVEDLIDRYLSGEDVSLTPETAPPEIVVERVDARIQNALLQKDAETVDALSAFKAEYLRSLAATQEPDAAAAPAPAEGTEPIPGSNASMENEAAAGLDQGV